MKKLLFSALVVAGFGVLAPRASAHSDRVFVGYDRCGRPVYEEVCRPEPRYQPRQSYYVPRDRYYEERSYYQPRYRDTRSRLSFSFGY